MNFFDLISILKNPPSTSCSGETNTISTIDDPLITNVISDKSSAIIPNLIVFLNSAVNGLEREY